MEAETKGTGGQIEALYEFAKKVARYNLGHCASETGFVVEEILKGHPIHVAAQNVEQYYPSNELPGEMQRCWRKLLRKSRRQDEDAEDCVKPLLEEIKAEIAELTGDSVEKVTARIENKRTKGPTKRRGRRKASYEKQQEEAALAKAWERARNDGVSKTAFARDNGYSLREYEKLLNRVAKRKARADK